MSDTGAVGNDNTMVSTFGSELGALVQWLERQAADGATRIVLRQKPEEGTEQLVREFPLAGTTTSALAIAIRGRAQDDGRHFRGRSLYGCFAYRERDYIDRFFFAVDGAEDAMVFGARDASLGSVTAQLMRHTEASARLAIGQTLDVISHYRALLAVREKRIEELEARNWEVMELYERLTSMHHDRELEQIRAQQKEKNYDFLRDKVDMLTPVFMAKLVPSAAKGAALGEELVRQFLKSLSPEQMAAIMGALRPEQAAVINEMYITYAEREMARQEAKKKSANGASGGAAPREPEREPEGGDA